MSKYQKRQHALMTKHKKDWCITVTKKSYFSNNVRIIYAKIPNSSLIFFMKTLTLFPYVTILHILLLIYESVLPQYEIKLLSKFTLIILNTFTDYTGTPQVSMNNAFKNLV